MNTLTLYDNTTTSHLFIGICLAKLSNSPIIITKKEYPFNIIYVNSNWEKLCLYSLDEVFMKPISIISYQKIYKNLKINKKKNNVLFLHLFKIYDISNDFSLGKTIFFKTLQ